VAGSLRGLGKLSSGGQFNLLEAAQAHDTPMTVAATCAHECEVLRLTVYLKDTYTSHNDELASAFFMNAQ
jgi:hypothetical protein